MRKSLAVGFILLFFCGALGVYALTLLLSSDRPYLLQRAEQRLGRKISARDARMTFIPGIELHLKDFVMADDSAFSSGVFLSADTLQVRFQFLPLLLNQLRIKKIILHDPVINIVRNDAGAYNFSSLGTESTNKGSLGRSETSQSPATRYSPPLTSISSIQVSNGRMRYFDQKNGSDLTISRLDLKVADSDYKNSFHVELAMAVFAAQQNFELKTAIGPLNFHNSVHDLPFDGELRVDGLDMGKIRAALPVLKRELPKALDLAGVYTTKDLRFKGTLNKPWLKGAVQGTDASFRFE
jgi:uncharacterized protein involved in outer membrane biogenesis